MHPHPEPYAGESDLETFKIFIVGILQWLSLNLVLGSGKENTAVQLRYLGMRLTGDALEWYSHNVEHYARATCHWTLESALVRLQERFLHPLTYRHMLMQFNTAQQGSGTVQDLLDRLTKFASQMVEYPDGYTM